MNMRKSFVSALAAVLLVLILNAAATAVEMLQIGNTKLQRVNFYENFTGSNDYFGALLYDTDGHLVTHDGNKTWMYTGDKTADGLNRSFVREFNLDTIQAGERSMVFAPPASPPANEKWAMMHQVIKVADDSYLAFYSTGQTVRAAVSDSPTGTFTPDPAFALPRGTQSWEAGTLESDGGMVKISESDTELRLWMLYDHLASGDGMGWAEVSMNKQTKAVTLLGKHPANPIEVLPSNRYLARCGGTVDSSMLFDGKHALFYMTQQSPSQPYTFRIGVALSDDPLFQTISENIELEGSLGNEQQMEKFQFYERNGHMFLIYEDWKNAGTGLREYAIVTPEPGTCILLAIGLIGLFGYVRRKRK